MLGGVGAVWCGAESVDENKKKINREKVQLEKDTISTEDSHKVHPQTAPLRTTNVPETGSKFYVLS